MSLMVSTCSYTNKELSTIQRILTKDNFGAMMHGYSEGQVFPRFGNGNSRNLPENSIRAFQKSPEN